MLTEYLQAAMRHAHYEILKDAGGYYGEIPQCRGVYVTGATLEECRATLAEVLEEWLLLRLHRQLDVPTIDGLELIVRQAGISREEWEQLD